MKNLFSHLAFVDSNGNYSSIDRTLRQNDIEDASGDTENIEQYIVPVDEMQNLEYSVNDSATQKELTKIPEKSLTQLDKKTTSKVGVGNERQRRENMDINFIKSKRLLQKQRENFDLVYFGSKDKPSFLSVIEKYYEPGLIDESAGLYGIINDLLDKENNLYEDLQKAGYQKSAEEFRNKAKQAKNFAKKYENELNIIVAAEAKMAGIPVSEYKRSVEYETFFRDIISSALFV